jgi:hypothetical protein
MFWEIVTILLFSISLSTFSQQSPDIDSVQKSFSKAYKKSVRFLKNENDTSLFVTAYNKHTHEVLGVILSIKKWYKSPVLTVGQYHYYFFPENMILIKVTADHSDNKHVGRAEYLFQNGKLASKKQDKYIEQDYSSLFANAALYRQISTEYIKQKFTD